MQAEGQGVKLTFMPFILKAASQALRQYPILNRCGLPPLPRVGLRVLGG
jgi:pyruvate/2-oxoglutarate dehydrogenase complex dihydrolipoamide acyltransferase (E2) component